jgi:hypothetical protein
MYFALYFGYTAIVDVLLDFELRRLRGLLPAQIDNHSDADKEASDSGGEEDVYYDAGEGTEEEE